MKSVFDRIRAFMVGRYGFDNLSRFLFVLSAVFWVLCLFVRFTPFRFMYAIFSVTNTALYIIAALRIFSKNIGARELENERYLQFRSRAIPRAERIKMSFSDREHSFRSCPDCGTLLRLKKIRGRHTTKCPNCGKKFKVFIPFGVSHKRKK